MIEGKKTHRLADPHVRCDFGEETTEAAEDGHVQREPSRKVRVLHFHRYFPTRPLLEVHHNIPHRQRRAVSSAGS